MAYPNWHQKKIRLGPRPRGFHLVTDEILSQIEEIRDFEIGIANIFIQHTSASLTLNENADPSVRLDFENYFNRSVKENEPYFTHTYEGPDDMPAHIKASLLGPCLSLPISDGTLALGTWQGIYLCEHRDKAGPRNLILTLNGLLFKQVN